MSSHGQSKRFLYEAITWLRSLPAFSSEVRDDDDLDPGHVGVARLQGWLAGSSHASISAYVALWGLFAGAVLSMFGMPAFGRGTNEVINEVGYVVLAIGVAAVIEYRVESRRHRTRLMVELRAASAPATEEALQALQREAAGRVVWMVSETPPTQAVLELATQLGVHWVTLEPAPKHAPHTPARAAAA